MVKKFYTTGEVARIVGVSDRTIKNYCTSGKLKSEKTLLTNYWRISYENLRFFFEENDLPLDLLKQKRVAPKVLVVDDDTLLTDLMTKIILSVSKNAIVEVSHDGYDACIKAGILIPDLILLDLKMPKADGFEVCKTIRENSATQNAKIIVITGFANDENLERLKEFKPLAVFSKPFKTEQFASKIKLFFAGQERH